MKELCIVLLLASAIALDAQAQLTPNEAVYQMTRGINLGNTLEPPLEGDWNNGPAQEQAFDDFKTAGFNTVRIPVRWDKHTLPNAPYTVDEVWLDRVEQVVDWGLERDFFILINAHHEVWLKNNYANESVRARFDSIWVQVAERFRNKSDSLLFEIINEPFGMTTSEVDDLNARILSIIRQSNPDRIVVYSGADYSGATWLMNSAVPNDDYIMGYYHSYDPWDFAGLGNGTWGTEAERDAVRATFESVAAWSATNDVPVMISEFGAIRPTDYNSRMRFYAHYVEQALRNRVPFQVWDDGGDFGLYDRDNRSWADEKDILISTFEDGPTDLIVESIADTLASLTWVNRTARNDSLIIERRSTNSGWSRLAATPKSSTHFFDETVAGGNDYYYRVAAQFSDGAAWISYPQRVTIRPTVRSNFPGSPFSIPGTIEAEDFDIGGEGLTYHDSDPQNVGGAYRMAEGVDIESRPDGGFHIAYVEAGEWLEYTVDVQQSGPYTVTTSVASLDGGGRMSLQFGDGHIRSVRAPTTGSWTSFEEVTSEFDLAAGQQVMRFTIQIANPFNVDRFSIAPTGTSNSTDAPVAGGFSVYPNPVSSQLTVAAIDDAHRLPPDSNVIVRDLLGRVQLVEPLLSETQKIDFAHLPSGVYLVRIERDGLVALEQTVVKLGRR